MRGSWKSDSDAQGRMEGMHMSKDTGSHQRLDCLSQDEVPALIDCHHPIPARPCHPNRAVTARAGSLRPIIRLPAWKPL